MDYYLNHTDNMSNPNFKTVNLSKPAELLVCTCGKNIFIELKANQYYGVPTDIFNGCRAVNKDYDIQELFDFIIDIFTPEDIKDIISDGYNTPKDVVTVILRQSKLGEIIIDRFLQDEEDDLIYNIDNEEVEKQIEKYKKLNKEIIKFF